MAVISSIDSKIAFLLRQSIITIILIYSKESESFSIKSIKILYYIQSETEKDLSRSWYCFFQILFVLYILQFCTKYLILLAISDQKKNLAIRAKNYLYSKYFVSRLLYIFCIIQILNYLLFRIYLLLQNSKYSKESTVYSAIIILISRLYRKYSSWFLTAIVALWNCLFDWTVSIYYILKKSLFLVQSKTSWSSICIE